MSEAATEGDDFLGPLDRGRFHGDSPTGNAGAPSSAQGRAGNRRSERSGARA